MNVTLYTFSKKPESTQRPTGGRSAAGTMREYTNLTDPVIRFTQSAAPSENYLYIPALSRYFWITNWTQIARDVWEANCTVDRLATYKDQIGASTLYVLRSASASNGRISDSKYPIEARANSYIDALSDVTITNPHTSTSFTFSNFWSRSLVTGYYYVGIAAASSTGVKWYCMNSGGFQTFIEQLFDFEPDDMSGVSDGIAKQFADPMQYIVGCYWYPVPPLGIAAQTMTIPFGHYTTTNIPNVYVFDPTADIMTHTATFPIRKHPQAAARGAYLNSRPFSRYRVGFYPFGCFELDSSLMIDDTTATATWYLDYTTGEADLILSVTNSFVTRASAKLGVPIRVSQATVDILGGAQNAINAGGSFISNLATGNVFGAASAVVGGFRSIGAADAPTISSFGGGGNFLPYNAQPPRLYSDFFYIADEDLAENGRPLCELRQISTLSGFVQVEKGDVLIPGTLAEKNALKAELEAGFYYE